MPVVVKDGRRKGVQAAVAAAVPNQVKPRDQVVGTIEILAFIPDNRNRRRCRREKDECHRRGRERDTPRRIKRHGMRLARIGDGSTWVYFLSALAASR